MLRRGRRGCERSSVGVRERSRGKRWVELGRLLDCQRRKARSKCYQTYSAKLIDLVRHTSLIAEGHISLESWLRKLRESAYLRKAAQYCGRCLRLVHLQVAHGRCTPPAPVDQAQRALKRNGLWGPKRGLPVDCIGRFTLNKYHSLIVSTPYASSNAFLDIITPCGNHYLQ